MTDSTYFPFSAVVGQADMKDALLCNAVQPDVGGVLISGTRGTAKSTAVRSLAHLLPRIRSVADCPYNCSPDDPELQCERCAGRDFADRPDLVEEIRTPFVDLPIGATEDRVLGTIDIETAIKEGERSFEPGLLARANRGILYVDEVNLLGDHLIDVLLDAVASGTNRVEREGVSVEHPANVLLVGTMNPEEGELRPQLLDRFGLSVDMDRGMDAEDRKAVVRRRTRYDAEPDRMLADWREREADHAERIETARGLVDDVTLGDEQLDRIVGLCLDHDVDGLRADIVTHRTATALAALDGARTVRDEHVERAAELALGHRAGSRSSRTPGGPDPSDDGESDDERSPDSPDKPSPDDLPDVDPPSSASDGGADGGDDAAGPDDGGGDGTDDDEATADTGGDAAGDDTDAAGGSSTDEDGEGDGSSGDEVFPISGGIEPPDPEPDARVDLPDPAGQGGRTRTVADDGRGAYHRARRPRGKAGDVALDATLRAAAPHQAARQSSDDGGTAVSLRASDLREKERLGRVRNLVVFVVDASGSMGAYRRMSAVKGAVLSLLEDAYQNRDAVSLVGFREDGAETLLSPTASVSRAARELADMPTGGRTPLAAGLERGHRLVERERRTNDALAPLLVLVTDGRPTGPGGSASPVEDAMARATRIGDDRVPAICFDTETGPVRMGLVGEIADRMGASYHRLDDLESAGISETVRDVFDRPNRPAG
ncbi:VWA domain-containing protein [Halorarum halobium]|uniref:VWA domain-containing protein n=1 Tax=Halorarum halobium TaxID=3075121 RepID=UPI0028AB20CA|nr:VWA domain-containing protein [Halobaculum sp. XH14]